MAEFMEAVHGKIGSVFLSLAMQKTIQMACCLTLTLLWATIVAQIHQAR